MLKNTLGFPSAISWAALLLIAKRNVELTQLVTAINRLDRLTSGLMIIPLSPSLAGRLIRELEQQTVRKTYLARCVGKFPGSCAAPRTLLIK